MTTTPPPDPLPNLNTYITQWQDQQNQQTADQSYLTTMIQQMMGALASGNTSEAYEIGEMCVMPGAMQVQGDQMGGLAASMNIGSALQTFTTDCQNIVNEGNDLSPTDAQAFVTYLQQGYQAIQNEMNLPASQQWLDPTTANNILDSMTKLSNEFGYSDPNAMGNDPQAAGNISNDVTQWISNPTAQESPNGGNFPGTDSTGQQHIQNLQSDFTQWNNSESAQSQSLTAQEQFASNTYNQYMNACENVFQSTQTFVQNIVQHEIAN